MPKAISDKGFAWTQIFRKVYCGQAQAFKRAIQQAQDQPISNRSTRGHLSTRMW
jgi:hypothetical protein